MLAHDAGQCCVSSFVSAGSLKVRTRMSGRPSARSGSLGEGGRGEDDMDVEDRKLLNVMFHHRNYEMDKTLEEHKSDVAFLVAAKKMFVSASQKRIYERFKEAGERVL